MTQTIAQIEKEKTEKNIRAEKTLKIVNELNTIKNLKKLFRYRDEYDESVLFKDYLFTWSYSNENVDNRITIWKKSRWWSQLTFLNTNNILCTLEELPGGIKDSSIKISRSVIYNTDINYKKLIKDFIKEIEINQQVKR